jgi:hypothetical protein
MTEEHDVVSVERYLWDEPPRVELLKMPREVACLIRAEHVDSEDEELGRQEVSLPPTVSVPDGRSRLYIDQKRQSIIISANNFQMLLEPASIIFFIFP